MYTAKVHRKEPLRRIYSISYTYICIYLILLYNFMSAVPRVTLNMISCCKHLKRKERNAVLVNSLQLPSRLQKWKFFLKGHTKD